MTAIKELKTWSEGRTKDSSKADSEFRLPRRPNNDLSGHYTHSKSVTKATHALLRMACLYWESWPRTKGSLHDAATHAGRCSPIMRHFITARKPWRQSSLRATFRKDGLSLLDTFGKTCFCFLRALNSFSFCLWKYKLPALSKWTFLTRSHSAALSL